MLRIPIKRTILCRTKMRIYASQLDKEEAAGTVYNASLPFLKVDECERVK